MESGSRQPQNPRKSRHFQRQRPLAMTFPGWRCSARTARSSKGPVPGEPRLRFPARSSLVPILLISRGYSESAPRTWLATGAKQRLSAAEKARLRLLRQTIGTAMSSHGYYYRDVDTCIPASQLYSYIRKVEQICLEHQLHMICFGHAMDGNLHTMILMKTAACVQTTR